MSKCFCLCFKHKQLLLFNSEISTDFQIRMQQKNKKVRTESVPKGTRRKVKMLFNDPIEMKHLNSAISHLRHDIENNVKTQHCVTNDFYCWTKKQKKKSDVYDAHSLRVKHTNYLAEQMRKALLVHNWKAATTLLNSIIISAGSRKLSSLITKACLVLLVHHPESNPTLFKEFIGSVARYESEADIEKMSMILCTIREQLPPVTTNMGSLWRQPTSFKGKKLIHNQEFTLLPLPPALKDEICQ